MRLLPVVAAPFACVLLLAGCTGDDDPTPEPSRPTGTFGADALPGDGWEVEGDLTELALGEGCSPESFAVKVETPNDTPGGRTAYAREGVRVVSGAWQVGEGAAAAALEKIASAAQECVGENPDNTSGQTGYALTSEPDELRINEQSSFDGENGAVERVYFAEGPVLVMVSSGALEGAQAPDVDDLVEAAREAAAAAATVDG